MKKGIQATLFAMFVMAVISIGAYYLLKGSSETECLSRMTRPITVVGKSEAKEVVMVRDANGQYLLVTPYHSLTLMVYNIGDTLR